MNLERRFYTSTLSLVERSATEEDNGSIGTLSGYIARFDSDSLDLGGFIERIQRGAFADSLRKNDVVALVGHDHNVVVGRLSAGTLRLREDEQGLAFDLDLPNTTDANNLKVLSKRGDLKGCSFGFTVDPEDAIVSKRGKETLVTLHRVNLIEVSVGVAFPAYPATSAMVRMIEQSESLSDRERQRARAKLRLFRPGSWVTL